jgi:predicted nuclease of predicted toxin-antitoxin system
VKQLGLAEKLDQAIWDVAKRDGYVILTQDDDFVDLSSLHGPLPKVIHLAKGNLTTKQCVSALRANTAAIKHFGSDPEAGLLVIR